MLTIREGLWAKIETTKGVDAVPTAAANAVLVSGLNWKLDALEMNDRAAEIGSGLGADRQSVFGSALQTITFDWMCRGSGAAGTAPEADALFRMCAMASNIVPATSVTYNPVSDFDSQETGTLYYPHDGVIHKLTGCVGTWSRTVETNKTIKFSFTITGHRANPVDAPFVAGTYGTTVPMVAKGATFDVGGYGAVISSLSFDYGAKISMPKDMSAADGYGTMGITKFSPKGTFDPLMVTVATNDFMGDFTSGANMTLDSGVIGSIAGNRVQFTHPAIYYTDMAPGGREGFRTYEVPYSAIDSAGDDFCSIIFT